MSLPEINSSTEEKRATGVPAFRDILGNAIRYWERRRILYNAVLLIVVLLCFIAAWPASKQALHFDSLLTLFILAVLANVAYCGEARMAGDGESLPDTLPERMREG